MSFEIKWFLVLQSLVKIVCKKLFFFFVFQLVVDGFMLFLVFCWKRRVAVVWLFTVSATYEIRNLFHINCFISRQKKKEIIPASQAITVLREI